jgi:hypothetical protein
MPQKIAEFSWYVDRRGYRWREGVRLQAMPTPPGSSLNEASPPAQTVVALEANGPEYYPDPNWDWYAPSSALYRTFTDLDGSPDGILAFANRYGSLGLRDSAYAREDPWYGYEEAVEAHLRSTEGQGDAGPALPEMPTAEPREHLEETILGWRVELAAMRMAVDLHDALASAHPEARLRPHFSTFDRQQPDGSRLIFTYETHTGGTGTPVWSTSIRHLGEGAVQGPAPWSEYQVRPNHKSDYLGFYYLEAPYIHEGDPDLVEYAWVLLISIVNAHLNTRIETQLLMDPKTARPVFFTMPNSLIGALWLQLAQAIDGKKDFQQCQVCRNWFELAPDKARSDKVYCSQACRSRAYRVRLRHAKG